MEDAIRHALAPTRAEIDAILPSTHAKIAESLLGRTHRRALDVGCGDGKFTRALAAICDAVTGIDVKQAKIAEAQEAAQAIGLTIDFRVASGEDLPFPDESFDVVAFSNSLHHMPSPAAALREALRVLAAGGALYIMEPIPAGNHQDAMRLVNDETVVRTDAYRAMRAMSGVETVTEVMYSSKIRFASFEAWKADQIDRDAKRGLAFDRDPELVRKTFESHADRSEGDLAFVQLLRVDLLRKLPRAS